MKLNKEELKSKISEKVLDNDLAIELLEDVEDSFETEDSSRADELQARLDDLQKKYKERFLKGNEKEEEKSDEVEEKEIIDIKEI